jgi:hypothetical protein
VTESTWPLRKKKGLGFEKSVALFANQFSVLKFSPPGPSPVTMVASEALRFQGWTTHEMHTYIIVGMSR